MTVVVIVLLGVFMLLAIVLPFVNNSLTEALPSAADPLQEDLEEERNALFAAIGELEGRRDLPDVRRQALRARYEAKAAKVLRQLDEHQSAQADRPPARPRAKRLPLGLTALLVLSVPSVALLGNYVLPRVGGNTTVTTNDASVIATAREVQRLERQIRENPTSADLLALADVYWQQGTVDPATAPTPAAQATLQEDAANAREKAAELYRRLETEFPSVPAIAYQRLGLLTLNDTRDLEGATAYLEKAREAEPDSLDTLFVLGDLYYAQGRIPAAIDAWESFLVAPNGRAEVEVVQPRLEAARTLAPLIRKVNGERSAKNLLALADAYWRLEDRNRAANLYAEAVHERDATSPKAVRRIGMALFFNGNTEDAVLALERAKRLAPDDLQTLLFLGNAYFSLGKDQRALNVWRHYVEVAGGEDKAGRVPGLIAQAEARLQGETPPPLAQAPLPNRSSAQAVSSAAPASVSGEQLFAANCASCHGANAEGGAGPKLTANNRMTNSDVVRATILNGRGMMPGFGNLLSEEEVEVLTRYVTSLAN